MTEDILDEVYLRLRATGRGHTATVHYLYHEHASPILLVHAATAPNAVRAADLIGH